MNPHLKWLIITLVGIVLGGAGWHENHQEGNLTLLMARVQQTREDMAAIKQAAVDAARRSEEAANQSKENSEKLDKILRKQDVILEKQKR